MAEHVFGGLDGAPRPAKPRRQGMTMVADWGLGPHAQEDLLVTAAGHCDFAKVTVGISRLLDNEVLRAKIRTYQEWQVEPFPGGQYLEYAEVVGQTGRYLPAVAAAGYRWVEVSDNLVTAGVEWKGRLIGQAVEEFGLAVLGEVGKKEGLEKTAPMVDDAQACLDAGARIVLLEAAELVAADPDTAREVEEVVDEIGLERVMFELPGPWIDGVASHHVHRMRRELVDRFGAQVNLGNVAPPDLLALEAYRRGLGVNAGGNEEKDQ